MRHIHRKYYHQSTTSEKMAYGFVENEDACFIHLLIEFMLNENITINSIKDRRVSMVVGLKTTCTSSAYHR